VTIQLTAAKATESGLGQETLKFPGRILNIFAFSGKYQNSPISPPFFSFPSSQKVESFQRIELVTVSLVFFCVGSLLRIFSVFTGHVIKTKNRKHSINEVKNLGYDR